ncbi:MAG: sigma-70 family RNA polymerase sigma factor [Blautia wexlerae]|nr:sigma-70 family RNA polymerase sigma factor [Blautia wexlerae]
MANTYLVKKDPTLPCSDENWMVMSYKEYKEWVETSEGMSRKIVFGKILPATENDNVIYIECDEDEQKKCKRENNKKRYSRYFENEFGHRTISYHSDTLDETEFSEEFLVDTETNVEEEVISKICIEQLKVVMDLLSESEKDLINRMFLDEPPLSEREYAKMLGIVPGAVNYRKKIVLSKMKKSLEMKNKFEQNPKKSAKT